MAGPLYFDRVMESTVSVGTGTYTLAGAVAGYQSFAVVGDGNTAPYCVFSVDANGVPNGGWEVGLGTYTASGTTLARTEVSASSNAGSAVNWGAGTKRVILTLRSNDVPSLAKIEEVTPSGTGVVTFSSLGAYTHLEIRYQGRGTQAATSTNINLTLNGDTGSNYDRQLLTASATAATGAESLGATSGAIGSLAAASAAAGLAGSGTIRFADYRGTTFQKSAVCNDTLQTGTGSGGTFSRQFAVWWRSTAAITSITLTLASGNYDTGTKFTLYGLR